MASKRRLSALNEALALLIELVIAIWISESKNEPVFRAGSVTEENSIAKAGPQLRPLGSPYIAIFGTPLLMPLSARRGGPIGRCAVSLQPICW